MLKVFWWKNSDCKDIQIIGKDNLDYRLCSTFPNYDDQNTKVLMRYANKTSYFFYSHCRDFSDSFAFCYKEIIKVKIPIVNLYLRTWISKGIFLFMEGPVLECHVHHCNPPWDISGLQLNSNQKVMLIISYYNFNCKQGFQHLAIWFFQF